MNGNIFFKDQLIHYTLVYLGLIVALWSCEWSVRHKDSSSRKSRYSYVKEYETLYIAEDGIESFNDSIDKGNVRHLVFTGTKAINLDTILNYVAGENIRSIRIDDYNQPVAAVNLKRLPNLNFVTVNGTSNLKKVTLHDIQDSLRTIYLSGKNLDFPAFDSAFQNVKFFSYEGKADTIPRWIENLQKVETFVFYSDQVSEIQCDVCKLKRLKVFSIVEPQQNDKQQFLQAMKVYPVILKFKQCKPELSFWSRLPPG